MTQTAANGVNPGPLASTSSAAAPPEAAQTPPGGDLVSDDVSPRAASLRAPPQRNALLDVVERLATNPDLNLNVLDRLLAVRREEENRLAVQAFNEAMAMAKGELQPVLKTHDVDFPVRERTERDGTRREAGRVKYKYEEFADVARVVDPVFAKYGLSYRFRVSQSGTTVKVTTIISHALGHSEETSPLEAVADPGSTGMSNVQALGATLSYLQRYSLRASIGLAAGRDTDGVTNASPPIEADQIRELSDLIEETGSSEVTMLRLIGAGSVPEMTQDQFVRAKEVLGLRKADQRSRKSAGAV